MRFVSQVKGAGLKICLHRNLKPGLVFAGFISSKDQSSMTVTIDVTSMSSTMGGHRSGTLKEQAKK